MEVGEIRAQVADWGLELPGFAVIRPEFSIKRCLGAKG